MTPASKYLPNLSSFYPRLSKVASISCTDDCYNPFQILDLIVFSVWFSSSKRRAVHFTPLIRSLSSLSIHIEDHWPPGTRGLALYPATRACFSSPITSKLQPWGLQVYSPFYWDHKRTPSPAYLISSGPPGSSEEPSSHTLPCYVPAPPDALLSSYWLTCIFPTGMKIPWANGLYVQSCTPGSEMKPDKNKHSIKTLVYMGVWRGERAGTHAHIWVHAEMTWDAENRCLLQSISRLNLKFTDLAKPASHQSLGSACLYPPCCFVWLFYAAGIWIPRSSCLHSKHNAHWSIFHRYYKLARNIFCWTGFQWVLGKCSSFPKMISKLAKKWHEFNRKYHGYIRNVR